MHFSGRTYYKTKKLSSFNLRGRPVLFLTVGLLLLNACRLRDISSLDNNKINLVQYVNPLIGTQSGPELHKGNTSPIASLPFGMNLWTPNTLNPDSNWIYTYDAKKIQGIRCAHQPNPILGDYGAFQLMPTTGELVIDASRRASEYSHANEMATPYSYEVLLSRYNIIAEIVPTLRGGMFKFTFPESESSYILLDALPGEAYLRIIPQQQRIVGFTKNNSGGVPKNFACYFVIEFDKPFLSYTLWNQDSLNSSKREIQGLNVGSAIKFITGRNDEIYAKVATSFVSIPQAIINFNRELEGFTFEQLKIKASQIWNNELNKIVVEGGTNDQKTIFYTSLYRALLLPKIFYEFDETGRMIHYSPFDGRVHDGYLYTDIGFWNAHRSLFPFFTIMYPEMNSNILKGMLNAYREGGWMPIHPSPGYRKFHTGNHATSIFTDAYMKNIRDFDVELAYQSMKKDAIVNPPKYAPGRDGLKPYNDNGYVPYPAYLYATTKTLEYAFDDFNIWKLGSALNKIDDMDLYLSKSLYYQNVFDKERGFMNGRNVDGEWMENFDPIEWGGPFLQGNAWHYTFNVPHDIDGLMNLMGGKKEFTQKLDELFSTPPEFKVGTYKKVIPEMTELVLTDMGQYVHSNSVLHHTMYLYSFTGQPWKTQELINTALNRLYKATPDGLLGDESLGSLSSWFLFSASGFYPLCPGTNEYVIGAPLFDKITFSLENGNTFIIEAPERSADNIYVESMELNGSKYEKNYILHSDIMNGGKLFFEMKSNPNKRLGREENASPFSLFNFQNPAK